MSRTILVWMFLVVFPWLVRAEALNHPTEKTLSLEGSVVALAGARDHPWLYVLTQDVDHDPKKYELLVMDRSSPWEPTIVGRMPLSDGGQMAFNPSEQKVLIIGNQVKEKKYNGYYVYMDVSVDAILIDVEDPAKPVEAGRKNFKGEFIRISSDGRFVAVGKQENIKTDSNKFIVEVYKAAKDGAWTLINNAIKVKPVSDSFVEIVFPTDGKIMFTQDGRSLQGVDIVGRSLGKIEFSYDYKRISFADVISDERMLVFHDARNEISLYALQPTVERKGGWSSPYMSLSEYSSSKRFMTRLFGNHWLLNINDDMYRLVISDSDQIQATDRYWMKEPLTKIVPGPDELIYAIAQVPSETPSKLTSKIKILDLARPHVPAWRDLVQAHDLALKKYAEHIKEGRKYNPEFGAIWILEKAGITYAIEHPIEGATPRRLAHILNDYGFWLSKDVSNQRNRAVAGLALRKALTLDPKRNVARMNLAEALMHSIADQAEYNQKVGLSGEIANIYREYLANSGKRNERLDHFLIMNLHDHPPKDVCTMVADYANADRFGELVGDEIDITGRGDKWRVEVYYQGTASVPHYYFFDSISDDQKDLSSSVTMVLNNYVGESDFESDARFIPFKDDLHLAWYNGTRTPVGSESHYGRSPCRFRTTIQRSVAPKVKEPQLCQQLLAQGGGNGAVEEIPLMPIDEGLLPEWQDNSDSVWTFTYPVDDNTLDVDHDGLLEHVVRMNISFSGGRGCKGEFLALMDKEKLKLMEGDKQNILLKAQGIDPSDTLRYLPHCNNRMRILRYGNKLYIENRSDNPDPLGVKDQYYRVVRFENGAFEEVCSFEFKNHVEVKK